jgi:multidrug resistance efflux pump
MIELLLCSLVTVLPDFLYRRLAQGKRLGREITLYSVWYELRWGITLCLLLTVSLLTLILYFHPGTSSAVTFFRTVPILPEGLGRVAEVYVPPSGEVAAGDPIFRLEDTEQQADFNAARMRVAEVDAEISAADADVAAAESRIREARSEYQQAVDELARTEELLARNASTVSVREVERLRNLADARAGALGAAEANRDAVRAQIEIVLPARRESALADLERAQVALDKTVVYAGISGRVQQFTLRPGDVVNSMLRPAGVLVPSEAGRSIIVAGFNQVEAQVLRVGMVAEAVCNSRPFEVLPLIVTEVQEYIAAGQVRPTDQLLDAQAVTVPGTLTVYLRPLFGDTLDRVPPGSSCFVNAYTSNYDELHSGDVGTARAVFLHVVDAVGLVHAMVLRVRAILLPVNTLVLSGGH